MFDYGGWPRFSLPPGGATWPHNTTSISQYGVTISDLAGAPSLCTKGGALGIAFYAQRVDSPVRTSPSALHHVQLLPSAAAPGFRSLTGHLGSDSGEGAMRWAGESA